MNMVKYLVIDSNTTPKRLEHINIIKKKMENELDDLSMIIINDVKRGLELFRASTDWALLLINIEPDLLLQLGNVITKLRQSHPAQIVAIALGIEPEEQLKLYQYGVDICFSQPTVLNHEIACAFFTNYYYRYKAFMACVMRHVDEVEFIKSLQKIQSNNTPLCFRNDLIIDPNKRIVTVGGKAVDLTAREYDLIYYFATHAGQVITRQEILENVFDSEQQYPSDINSRICRLRKKIERDSKNPTYIYTKRQVGYIFLSE